MSVILYKIYILKKNIYCFRLEVKQREREREKLSNGSC